MKSTKTKALTDAEINQGFHRLAAAPFMNVKFKQGPGPGDLRDLGEELDVLNFKHEPEPSLETIPLPRFRDQEPHVIRNIIVDLAVSLVVSRLTPEEAFRLGTSEEAIDLFGSHYTREKAAWKKAREEWQANRQKESSVKAAGTEEAGA